MSTTTLSLDAIETKPRMRREAGSPKILVSGNWLFQSSVSWCWPKGTWALGTRLCGMWICVRNKDAQKQLARLNSEHSYVYSPPTALSPVDELQPLGPKWQPVGEKKKQRKEKICIRDWSKSTGGWAGAFQNVVVRKHMTHHFHLAQNFVTHP